VTWSVVKPEIGPVKKASVSEILSPYRSALYSELQTKQPGVTCHTGHKGAVVENLKAKSEPLPLARQGRS